MENPCDLEYLLENTGKFKPLSQKEIWAMIAYFWCTAASYFYMDEPET